MFKLIFLIAVSIALFMTSEMSQAYTSLNKTSRPMLCTEQIFYMTVQSGIRACHATPAVYCGVFPPSLFKCLNNPGVFSSEVSSRCTASKSECEKSTCLFREANLLDGTAVNKEKFTSYLTQYVKEHPQWAPAVEHAKTACLGDSLPAQGWYIDCPTYDIIHCMLSSFIRFATLSQWPSTKECEYPHVYAGACPICPEDCFSPQVPIGSCNACRVAPTLRTK